MENITINLTLLIKHNLTINGYLTLLKIHNFGKIDIPFTIHQDTIESLLDNDFILLNNREYLLTNKAIKLFPKEIKHNINFEELFNLYPAKTPSGRILRAKSKQGIGGLTKDYESCSKKYLKLITKIEDHNQIILATKNMIKDHKNRGALDYLQKLETYINQNAWDKYIGQTEILEYKPNVEKL